MIDERRKIITGIASEIVLRGMAVPAIFFLDMFKYLSFLFSQAMIVFGPLATIFINQKKYYQISTILSKRNNVEYFIDIAAHNCK